MALLIRRPRPLKAPEAGAGVEEASKLLRSVRSNTEGLAAEIQSCGHRRRRAVEALGAEVQTLRDAMLQIWDAVDLHRPSASQGTELALLARDAALGLDDVSDMVEYRCIQLRLAPPPARLRLRKNPLLSRLLGCDGSSLSCKPNKIRKVLFVVAQETSKLLGLLEEGATSLHPPPPASLQLGCVTSQTTVLPRPKGTVVGRDMDREAILRMLTDPCPQPGPGPLLISIVGVGGVGKTALASQLYNHTTVQQRFDITCWVFVSSSFNNEDLVAEILRSANPAWTAPPRNMADLSVLQSELQQFLASKRCLIVLDGMWEKGDWQAILTPLRSAGTGSRILVTTRQATVSSLPSASQVYHLDALSTEDCWALIKEHAFHSDSEDAYPDLQLLGRKIAAQIGGLPLPAKFVGRWLEATRSKEHWQNIMGALGQQDPAFPALCLSYGHLPGHLKRCFAYCSLFPKNWKFDPPHLIRLWTAQGFVQPRCRAEEREEDCARQYFDQLLSCSFFEEIELGSKKYYLMHDLVHDLAQLVSKEHCFRIERGMSHGIPSTVRHLSVTMNNLHHLISFCKIGKLRTLLVLRSLSSSSNCFDEGLLKKLTDLRILDLSGCDLTELPQSIGNLLHLRYLSVHGNIRQLPRSISKLLHLQYLCFSDNCSFDKLPAAITMLVNLRHLCVGTKYTTGLADIGRLVNLQGSLEFHVEKLEGRTLEQLQNINGLSNLKIKGLENVSSIEEAFRAEMNKKRYLNSLSLEWGSTYRKLHPPADAEVLKGLVPHPDLKELRIRRYCGTEAPSWLQSAPSLQQLQSLHLINCRRLGRLPALGNLRSLRTLHMRELCAVEIIGHEFYGIDDVAFPCLDVLELDDFPRLHDWSVKADKKSFPCLQKLTVMDCPALTQIPPLPSTACEVSIERTQMVPYIRLAPSSSSPEMLQLDIHSSSFLFKGFLHEVHFKSIVALNISGAEQFVAAEELGSFVSLQRLQLSQCDFTDQTLSKFLQALTCVSSLEIIDLPNITSLPVKEKLKVCPMVKELHIRNCQLLHSLSSLQFFESLRYLEIERCSSITTTSFPENFVNLSSLKVLRISYCSELQSFPACGLPSSLESLNLIGCHPELSKTKRNRNIDSVMEYTSGRSRAATN